MCFRCRFVIPHHLRIFQTAEELDLPKLFGLKSARGTQATAKGEEMRGKHCLEDSELLDKHAGDLSAPPQQARRLVNLIALSAADSRLAQVRNHRIEFMKQLLEPQLVRLVNDYEKQFIVMFRPGLRVLKFDQLRHSEVIAVGQLFIPDHRRLPSAAEENNTDRLENNPQVEPEGDVLDVVQIVLQLLQGVFD